VHFVVTFAVPAVALDLTVQLQTHQPGVGWLGEGSEGFDPFGYATERVHVGPTGALIVTFALPPKATGERMAIV
jgi:hypothetical protein